MTTCSARTSRGAAGIEASEVEMVLRAAILSALEAYIY
jgi:hypothetical protein